jgi:hypothetical protein
MRVVDALTALRGTHGESALKSPRFIVPLGAIKLVFPNPGKLPLHDLHHVALGARMDFWGEVQVSVYELRTKIPTPLIGLLCVGAIALGMLRAPRQILRWWREYRGCASAYTLGPRYDEILQLDVSALQRELGLKEQA